jgi:uncharacterized protein YkwD
MCENLLCQGLILLSAACVAVSRGDETDQKLEISNDERAVIDLTNQEREQRKLPPLKANPILFRVARAHSANMAKKGELKHDLDCKTPGDRLREAGYRFREAAENIAAGMPLSPKEALDLWMKSDSHKANILKENITEIGIGIARSDGGEVYYTQVFATPLAK